MAAWSGWGCQSAFERYYVPASVEARFAPIDPQRVRVIESAEQPAGAVRQDLYPEAVLVGTASFIGSHPTRGDLRKFAAQIGADLAIWSARYLDTIVYTDYDQVNRNDKTTIVTGKGQDKTVTTVETDRIDVIPRTITVDQFHHEVLYLRRR